MTMKIETRKNLKLIAMNKIQIDTQLHSNLKFDTHLGLPPSLTPRDKFSHLAQMFQIQNLNFI